MHVVDGALSTSVLIAGGVLTVAGVAVGLRKLDADRLPQVGVLSAMFFVASLVHVPVGPSSVHLILNGLVGVVLGWSAFPALIIALLLQAVFFGFGGITVLGINAVNIALPAIACFYLFGGVIRSGTPMAAMIGGFAAGACAIAFTCVLVSVSLAMSGDEFLPAAKLVFFAHLPVMAVEGILTGAAIVLVRKVKPDLLSLPFGSPV